MLGNLYIVATPIGNLEDITLRAINILKDVDCIIAEDTRITKKLLDFIATYLKLSNYNPNLISYHQHSGEGKKFEILNMLLNGKNLALVTDAGTPGISDPGNELIDFLLSYKSDLKVIPIPGPSSITAALSVSGFRTDKFLFLGFWPKKKQDKLINYLKTSKLPFVFYESPFRIIKTLITLKKAFGGDIRVFVGRELTKLYESLYRGKISEVLEKLQKERLKGEIVVVVEV